MEICCINQSLNIKQVQVVSISMYYSMHRLLIISCHWYTCIMPTHFYYVANYGNIERILGLDFSVLIISFICKNYVHIKASCNTYIHKEDIYM